jgi:hypothetical protein
MGLSTIAESNDNGRFLTEMNSWIRQARHPVPSHGIVTCITASTIPERQK